jgi:hypothetical protein
MPRPFIPAALIALVLGLSGCESLSDATSSVREKLAAREEPRTHSYTTPQRATYEAARVAVVEMGFKVTRGGAAQGELDAVSDVSSNDTLRGSRQITLKLRLRPALDGGTDASILLQEIIESDSSGRPGMGTATPLRDTPLYEVFFRTVQQKLDAPRKG